MVLLVPLESSSSSMFQWKYDVFLSFRGGDTRTNFTDHLYATLHRKGVFAFKDDKELERGKNKSLDLLQAIRDSRFSIIIFSKNYADSTWCLEELEIIFERMKQGTLTVIPIFYGVDPSEVQELTGEYGKAFTKHTIENPEKVLKWRVAVKEIANVSGWDSQNRHEVEFIQDIVEGLIDQLRNVGTKFSKEEEGPVGIDNHLMKLRHLLLQGRSNDVSIIGICGMGGIGKTTIARALYDKMYNQFEWRSFLLNVRETEEKHGLVRLQEQLLSEVVHEDDLKIWDIHKGMNEIRNRLRHIKALIVLDDVDNLEQLKSLAARSDWFGAGSIIIITTRNDHLLSHYESYQLYKVTELDSEEALELFCLKAFKRQNPKEGYKYLSHGFVEYCKGLPLAIHVIGSFLNGRSIDEWHSALERLKKIPNKCILDKLQISFDGLEETEKQTFLDIACFFKGQKEDHVKRILESCDLYPDIGIRVLIDKSLISIDSFNRIMMHDLLQEMGHEIVKRQSPKEPGKRSRLWLYKDVYHVFSNNTGTENVEAIKIEEFFKVEKWSNVKVLSTEVFLKMKKLRLLKLPSLSISCGLASLPDTLRFLHWYKFPFKSLPDGFYPNKLVELHLCRSKLKQLWKRTKSLSLEMLRVIDLSHSEELILTPDFTKMPNLEVLNLKGCIKLSEMHKSIGVLKKLISLNLRDCKSLTSIPPDISDVKSLKILNLNGCSNLETLPKRIGELTYLEHLDLGGIGKRAVSLAKPWKFLLPWKKQNTSLSMTLLSSLSNLCSLTKLNLSDCHLKTIPFDFGCFPLLEELNLSRNDFISIPSSINGLSKLNWFWLLNCKNLEALPECPLNICLIDVDGCTSLKRIAHPKSKSHFISAANCIKLVENQKNLVWAFFASFLHSLAKGRHEDLQVSIRFSGPLTIMIPGGGGDIPEWLTYKTSDRQLVVTLPPNWYNDQCLGFALCCAMGSDQEQTVDMRCLLSIEDYKCPLTISTTDAKLITDHFWVQYILLSTFMKSEDWWNQRRNIKLSLSGRGKPKMLGFRVVYEQDVEEIMQYATPSKRSRFDTGKRARPDDFYDDGEGESSEGGGSCSSYMELEISSSKRLKSTLDDDD